MIKKVLIEIIKFYKNNISPMTKAHCRYEPSCSSYALQALEKYGCIRGLWLGFKRILRCNPFFKGGYDPLP